jgi:hypothetical protein
MHFVAASITGSMCGDNCNISAAYIDCDNAIMPSAATVMTARGDDIPIMFSPTPTQRSSDAPRILSLIAAARK